MILDVNETFKTLKAEPSNAEKRWFEEHPQFRHLFLRTTDVAKRREVWFIVNGVLILYGLRKHALIPCLNCRNYLLRYKEFGDRKSVKHHFKEGELIRLEDVKAKLVAMGPHRDMLKMIVFFRKCCLRATKSWCKSQ
ncbi:unnamed protein product [Brassica rapa]|uniref:DUF1985 domain-containing protein n=1 Tax=Brassica campestris TaxID=3711 RepID=A0A3P6A4C6_BRACM|nr:unnamed protein product [Brassica rapa]VDC84489.1 unnamed protein product [Brassica rapa]